MKASDSIVICDSKTKGFPIQFVSQGFQELFGYESSECIGARCNEVFGCARLMKDKPSRAALNMVAAQLGLSEDETNKSIKRMAKAAEEAAQSACDVASQPVLLIISRKNGELFVCEWSLCMNQHPTVGWHYHAGLSRDVTSLVPVAKLLKAATADNSLADFCQAFRKRTAPLAGAPPLRDQLAAAAPELHTIAEQMWKTELQKVFKPKEGTLTSSGSRSIWSKSTASTLSSRTKRSRSESLEADSDHEAANIPHLGAFFSQFTSEASSEGQSERSAEAQPRSPEEAVVQKPSLPAPEECRQEETSKEGSRFLDLLEGSSSDEEDEDSEGDERMAFANSVTCPADTKPVLKAVGRISSSSSERRSSSDDLMEEASQRSLSTSGESPMSEASMLCEEVLDPVTLINRRVLLDLEIPLVMAAPTVLGCPVVLRSAGFQALAEPSAAIPLGSSAIETLGPASEDMQSIWTDFCTAMAHGHFHIHGKTGGGVAALDGFEDVVLPAGELTFTQPFRCRSGRLVTYLVYMKQVELDNCPYLLVVHSALPEAEAASGPPQSTLDFHFVSASAQLDEVISNLASEFFYYAPMRRQRMRPKLPQGSAVAAAGEAKLC